MKSITCVLLLCILLFSAAGCNPLTQKFVTGSGNTEAREFSLTGFTGIQAAVGFVVQASKSSSYRVQLTADDNLWEYLDVSVSGGTLHLQSKPGVNILNAHLQAVVTLPSLKNLDFSGAASGNLKDFNSTDSLRVKISGAGMITMDNVKFGSTTFDISGAGELSGTAATSDIKFTVSGAGRVTLSGSGTQAAIEASGASRLSLGQFDVQTLTVTLSGASEAHVNAHSISRANISGASFLYYADSPTLGNMQTTGGSSIIKE